MSEPSHLYHFGKIINQMREYRKLSTKELSDLTLIPENEIIEIESGKENFKINTFVRIAAALDCYLDVTLTPREG